MDEVVPVGLSLDSGSRSVNLDGVRMMALRHIEMFVHSFSVPRTSSTVPISASHMALAQVAEAARIPEAGHLRCRFPFLLAILFKKCI